MYDLLITHANVATMADGGYGLIPNGAVAIQDDTIAWVGKTHEALTFKAHETIDAGGCCLTPGLIDCHTHLVYAGDRSAEFAARLKGASYEEIAKAGGGIRSTVLATRVASEESLFEQSSLRLRALIASGVTTVEIKSGYGLNLETERHMLHVARQLGAALPVTVTTTFLGAHAVPPEYEGRADAYMEHLCHHMLPILHSEGLVDAVDGFCEKIGFSAAQVDSLFHAASALGIPVKLHAEQLSNQQGAALAARYHALSADHLEYVDEAGVAAMAEAGTVAVLVPGAFYYLHETHKPPINLFRKYKVPMAVSTDCNPGTSPITHLPLALNMACVLFGLTAEEALSGATLQAAKALRMEASIGSIEAGKSADLVLWEAHHPDMLSYTIPSRLRRRWYQGVE